MVISASIRSKRELRDLADTSVNADDLGTDACRGLGDADTERREANPGYPSTADRADKEREYGIGEAQPDRSAIPELCVPPYSCGAVGRGFGVAAAFSHSGVLHAFRTSGNTGAVVPFREGSERTGRTDIRIEPVADSDDGDQPSDGVHD